MTPPSTPLASQVTKILIGLLNELSHQRTFNTTLEGHLDRDYGLDSLARVEFFRRLERQFGIQFSESTIMEAQTLRDVIQAVENTQPKTTLEKQKTEVSSITPLDHVPQQAGTLVDVLLHYAQNYPERTHIILQDENTLEQIITYGRLYENALQVAGGLQNLGLKPNETVAIMLPTSESFFYAFFGTLLAGGIPVPIYPPVRPDRIEEYALRESAILRNAEAQILITFHKLESLSRLLKVFISSLKSVTTVEHLMHGADKDITINNQPEEIALIQYTSGSTNIPKGVVLTHQNLLANIRAYGKAIEIKPTDIGVSWLPLYHDMGLIGAWLGSFYYGIPVIIMSPFTFLSRPERWLWTIHDYRATLSAGPNFAYELCVKKIDPQLLEGLDLSSWRLSFNGAEAVNPKTIQRFIEKFQPYGFKPETMFPVYGLAESSVALCFPKLHHPPRIDEIQRAPFEKDNKAIAVTAEGEPSLEFVGCGTPLENHEIRIVDKNKNILGAREVGELQFRGPSAMRGYYHNPEATDAVKADDWWYTGDLAYIAEGHLFITGRKKDLIIRAGRNIYPEEVEELSSQVPGIRKGCVAAFGVHESETGTERLIVVAETQNLSSEEQMKIKAAINDKVTTALGNPPDEICLVPPRSIPKTSSGKLRRSSCKTEYLKHALGKKAKPTWLQMLHLFFLGGVKKIIQVTKKSLQFIYTVYVTLVCVLLLSLITVVIKFCTQTAAQKFVRKVAGLCLFLCGCKIKVKGHLPAEQQGKIFVANHASYVDVIALLAVLPFNTVILAKQELSNAPWIGSLIKKLGHLWVERANFAKSLSDLETIKNALLNHKPIAIFPEGTFSYSRGIQPFKLGAFKIAAETQTPICPVALQGTRYILRSGSALLRPGKIIISFGSCLIPTTNTWDEIVRLRDESRELIAIQSGEEKLG